MLFLSSFPVAHGEDYPLNPEIVPSKGINFGTSGWTDFDQDQGVRSDEKSSEPEKEKPTPPPPQGTGS
jgi:hypothetical protein